ncbi:hypothetical protein C1645_826666 [Glomus cerebriforme]|uniref:SbsA Ig-like domain-containing protein n=1 Tax=Glomus cerebriforme TaxID=658196 RepID=A0A397STJ9_9GLOM|nr:hypothetical protein C1645_826666 [Glomus cerebriforme]
MKNLSGTNFLLFYFLLLFINTLAYESILYNETEPGLKIERILTFRDRTSVITLVKPINESCTEPRINLRVLHPNGTIDASEVDYPIPDFNFCRGTDEEFFLFDIDRSFPESLYILYINSTDIASASYYVLLVTRMGQFISNTYIAPISILNGSISSNGHITSHISEEYGFMFLNYETETVVMWIYFSKPDDEGKLSLLNKGKYYLQNSFDEYYLISAIGGSYAFIATTTNPTDIETKPNESINPYEFTYKVYMSFIKPIMNGVDGPFLIYQSAIPHLNVDAHCDATYTGTGYFCILLLERDKPKKSYLIKKISIQNSGSVTVMENFADINVDADVVDKRFNNLFPGGFLLTLFRNTTDSYLKTVEGILLYNDGRYYGTWDFPKDLKVSQYYTMSGYRNRTMLVINQEDEMSWRVLYTTLPKFTSDDYGYENPNINSTYPLINSNIPLSVTNINITYHSPIAISTNNISIYQYRNDIDLPILRQSIPGNSPYFSYSPDNKTINIKVLESTFNQPNSNYYVVVQDDAIKDWNTNQPLIGIEKNRWKFNTNESIGRFSMTEEGLKFFQNLSLNNQRKFLTQLRIDLASSIPVDINRLDDIKCCEYDNSQIPPRTLLSLAIKSTTDPNERNVDRILKDLDILIKEKEITPISWFGTTTFLDASFGFQRTENFLDSFKFHLIGIIIVIVILGLLYIYAKKRYPLGKNIVIFKFSLIILNFILGIMFILSNGKKVPQLFIPSIIFCIIPITVNFMISIIIILREIKKNRHFYKWFKNNTNIAVLFTILASTDLEMLNILSSQVAGIMLFSASISKKTQSYIFWGSLIGFFIEDIPRFIIQKVNY